MIGKLRRMLHGPFDVASDLQVVAVAGALRSGTNYLKFLLEQNYHVVAEFNAFGWKHAGVPVLAGKSGLAYPDMPLVYVVKGPYAFVVSLHRYHQRKLTEGHRISIDGGEDFDSFLSGPVTVFDSQSAGSPQMRFANPVQYWNFLYWNLETLDPVRFRVAGFNYEDLIADPDLLCRNQVVMKLRRRSEAVATPTNRLKRLGETAGSAAKTGYQSGESFDSAYYTEKRYLDSFTPAQLSFMRAEIDPWLMARRGYEII